MGAKYGSPAAGVGGILVTDCDNRGVCNTRLQNDCNPTSSGNKAGLAFRPFDGWNPTRDSPTEGETVMKRNTLIITTIVGALGFGLLATTPVLARDPGYGGNRGVMMFDRFDNNHDGNVTRKEFRNSHSEDFKRMDLNGGGKVTRGEARQARRQIRTQDWGKGGQGVHHARFEQMDSNRDGRVTRNEARQARQHVRVQDWDKGGKGNYHARLEQMDSNHDGRITRNEARQARPQMRAQVQSQ
jgi:Ca2+-binding EF-hand superfamily protein